jgi:hypothetical protein
MLHAQLRFPASVSRINRNIWKNQCYLPHPWEPGMPHSSKVPSLRSFPAANAKWLDDRLLNGRGQDNRIISTYQRQEFWKKEPRRRARRTDTCNYISLFKSEWLEWCVLVYPFPALVLRKYIRWENGSIIFKIAGSPWDQRTGGECNNCTFSPMFITGSSLLEGRMIEPSSSKPVSFSFGILNKVSHQQSLGSIDFGDKYCLLWSGDGDGFLDLTFRAWRIKDSGWSQWMERRECVPRWTWAQAGRTRIIDHDNAHAHSSPHLTPTTL